MQDESLATQLQRIERQLNVLILLLGGLVTIAIFTAVDYAGSLVFLLIPGMFAVLLLTYLIAAIVTPGRPQPEPEGSTRDAEVE